MIEQIREIQRLVGVAQDGLWGPRTEQAVLSVLKQARGLAETGPGATKPGAVASGGLGDAAAFYAALRASFGTLDQPEVEGFHALLEALAGWPVSWAAYALATAWHETAHTMQPVAEAYWLKEGPRNAYLKKMYDIEGDRPAKARELGNTIPGDGVEFAGRGYVQLTGRTNYAKAAEALGIPLIGNPNLAMRADEAARILVWGMEGGRFTGKKLGDYLPSEGHAGAAAFREARRIINGLDKADEIAAHAMKFQAALQAGGWE